MAVESNEELLGFFNPEEFGEEMTAVTGVNGSFGFHGIISRAYTNQDPNLSVAITSTLWKVLCRQSDQEKIEQGDTIQFANGGTARVVDSRQQGTIGALYLNETPYAPFT